MYQFSLQLVDKEKRTKRYLVHLAILTVVLFIVVTNLLTTSKDEGSILFALFGDDKLYTDNALAARYIRTSSHLASYLTAVNTAYAEEAVNPYPEIATSQDNSLVRTDSPLTSESNTALTAPEGKVAEARKGIVEYTVVEGDTTSTIAANFGISTNTVLWANDLHADEVIKPGDTLRILPVTGIEHKVKRGDTIDGIAREYDADSQDIRDFNGIKDETLIAGETIIVPDGYITPAAPARVAEETPAEIPPVEKPPVKQPRPASAERTAPGEFVWPTTSHHISQYFRWGHTGIDIDNRAKPPVFAADSGVVEWAGWHGGYGKAIIINHGGGIKTLYGHTEIMYVKPGQEVKKGEAIAKMGSTGHSTGPHVHFEVIKNGVKKNPLSYY